jgi:organic radical activating enzyme
MKYPVAERFKAPQGEGDWVGSPMAFIRLVGCSVGQKVCTSCDTQFEHMTPALGGGLYTVEELIEWSGSYNRLCITGGEPLDRDLRPLIQATIGTPKVLHIETSGTKMPAWLLDYLAQVWLCVSPKPGYLPAMIGIADEIKVIHRGLGDGPGWPTIEDAVMWAGMLRDRVFLQPRNDRLDVNETALREVLDVIDRYPQLRLSAQLHKFIRTR